MNAVRSARELGLVACEACGAVWRLPPDDAGDAVCRRCRARVHSRKPRSLERTWAFLIAAAILYLPANLIPIMKTATLMEQREDTIMSGVIALWRAGSPEIAIIVFAASIVVPIAKIVILAFLLITTQRRWAWRPAARTRLYRAIEFVGYWSMLDVFVVALLVALVHFRSFADVQPGGGAVAFAAVVVLTMVASKSFDPRLIWDRRPAAVSMPP
ncbi:paraquat-inducible protein A [Fontimonas sp. SYSU GA230001]|uniref:paraquat-inducible protein A n=1 Tax=Fontimonas sp. SYSU GA230001 TaxID=3142450 RepID=UPI0032B3AD87